MDPGFRHSEGKERPDPRLRRQASARHGILSRDQLIAAGLSPSAIHRRVASGELEPVHYRVYRVAGSPRTWLQDLMAACLSLEGVVSHRAAAALLGLDGFGRSVVELSVSRKTSSPDGATLHVVQRLDPIDVTRKDGIPVTTVIRTLADLGSVVDRDRVEVALDHALRKRMTSTDQLLTHLERLGGKGRRGAGVLRAVLTERTQFPTESVAERRFLGLVKRSRVLLPESQFVVTIEGGGYRLDFVWRSCLIVVEVEGYDAHSGRLAWERDLARRNELTRRGWRVLHVTWWEMERRPERVIALLKDILGA